MLRAVLNKSWKQHPTKQQLYGHISPISKTIQIWRTNPEHCRRIKDEFKSNVPLWTPSNGRASVGQPASIYRQQLSADLECSLKDLPEAMDDRDEWRERELGKSVLVVWHDDDVLSGNSFKFKIITSSKYYLRRILKISWSHVISLVYFNSSWKD